MTGGGKELVAGEEKREELLDRARVRGVNKPFYWLARTVLEPPARIYFRFRGVGKENIPRKGGVIVAMNHRSFLDPFLIVALTRRQAFFVAKRELFEKPGLYGRSARWFISNLGAFPIDRGVGDEESMATARELIERGEVVMIFPEGTRVRPGPLGSPRSGVGRLALETGAPVVPVAAFGTENVRRGWRIYPRKITVRAGRPMTFPQTENPDRELAAAVTSRVWPQVELLWESLGGTPPIRRVAVVGAGACGASLAGALRRAECDVVLGARTAEEAAPQAGAVPAEDIDLAQVDAVVLAVPARDLPAAVGELEPRLAPGTAVVTMAGGLLPEGATTPTAYCRERLPGRAVACLGGPAPATCSFDRGAAVAAAGEDPVFVARLRSLLAGAGCDVEASRDVVGVELAGAAAGLAVLATTAGAQAGPGVSGVAAARVFSEVAGWSQSLGAGTRAWLGMAGAGDLVASVVAGSGLDVLALLAGGGDGDEMTQAGEGAGRLAEAMEAAGPLAGRIEASGGRCPALRALADLVAGSVEPEAFARAVTEPRRVVGARIV